MDRFEYRDLKADVGELSAGTLRERLDVLGAEGWRVVAAVPRERHGYLHEVYLLLMRKKP